MELNDAARRIVGEHWKLIVAFMLAAIALVTLAVPGGAANYLASTRLVLDTQDPQTQSESAAIADTAKAIATSPSQVTSALRRAHIAGRDVKEVAAHHVAVRSLGTSGILELSISDRDPRAAAAIANALANRVIETRLGVTRGQGQQVLADLDGRLARLSRDIAALDAGIDTLTVQMAAAGSPDRANALRAQRDEAARQRDFLAQKRSVVEAQRVGLLSTGAQEPQPRIISPATVPHRPEPSSRWADLFLAAVLGLVLGLGVAAAKETLRPTLVGGDALAHELDTPLLGTLERDPARGVGAEEALMLALRLRLAAKAAGVRTVRLLAPRDDIDVDALAERLDTVPTDLEPQPGRRPTPAPRAAVGVPTAGAAGDAATAAPVVGPACRIRRFEFLSALNNGVLTGIVLVAPDTLKRTELVAFRHLLRASAAPLLGVVTYHPSRSHGRLARLLGPHGGRGEC